MFYEEDGDPGRGWERFQVSGIQVSELIDLKAEFTQNCFEQKWVKKGIGHREIQLAASS